MSHTQFLQQIPGHRPDAVERFLQCLFGSGPELNVVGRSSGTFQPDGSTDHIRDRFRFRLPHCFGQLLALRSVVQQFVGQFMNQR